MKHSRGLFLIIASILFGILSFTNLANAEWSHDPSVNTAITTQAGADTNPVIIDDGSGGAIIAWQSASNDIHVQRIDTNGNLAWGDSGKALTSDGNNYYPQIATDMSGGAFIVWQKGNGGDGIYAQRIDSHGNELWSAGGEIVVLINEELSGSHRNPRIVSDGQEGAIVVWEDSRTFGSTGLDIYGQRFHTYIEGEDVFYEEYWGANGVPICQAPGDQINPQLTAEDTGGAIFTWQDSRSGKWKIMALRIDGESEGSPATGWAFDGNPVSFSDQDNVNPRVTGDGSNGAIITWQVGSDGSGGIHAQRMSGIGAYPWMSTELETTVATSQNKLQNPQMVSDGSGGAVIFWLRINSGDGSTVGIFAQRLDANGAAKWTENGVAVVSSATIDTGDPPGIVSDGNAGAVIAWGDRRNGDYDVYSQRIAGTTGTAQWSAEGVQVSTAINNQQLPRIISYGGGGAIFVWQDLRSGEADIYSQKVLADGTLPVLPPTVSSVPISIITSTSATGGGEVTSEGGTPVTDRGICWGVSPDPVKGSGNYISAGSGTGPFTGLITDLTANTTYHARAYATNSIGTSYGSDISFATNNKYGLNLTFAGTGKGSVSFGGTTCGSACTFLVDPNTTATLQASTLPFYSFTSWAGACTGGLAQCSVLMNSDNRSATATFTLDAANSVRIKLPTEKRYSSINDAIRLDQDGRAVIDTWGCELTDNPDFNRGAFTLKGGWDSIYSKQNGATTINGTLTVKSGSLTVERVAIK